MSKKSKPSYSVGKTVGKLIADLKPIAWALFICAVICVCSVLLTVQTPEIINDMTNMLYDYGTKGTTLDMVQMGKWCIQLLRKAVTPRLTKQATARTNSLSGSWLTVRHRVAILSSTITKLLTT